MSSSYAWKLRALLKKNLILMKRNFISTLFEIFFPSIIIVVILILRKAFSVDTHDFSEEGSIESFIKDKSMTSINYNLYSNLEDQEWNGLSLLSPFQICSSSNEQFEERKIIASLGIPGDIKQQMINGLLQKINMIALSLISKEKLSSLILLLKITEKILMNFIRKSLLPLKDCLL